MQEQAQMNAAAQRAANSQQSAPAQSDDLMTQLQNLATMHSQGILSADEFAAAKAKLLG
jgi:hypothetical protein